jgi:hypothetical protein
MQLKERTATPLLATKLGDVPHVSGLLRRIARISGAGERVGDWLPKVAVQRGATHYRRDFDVSLPPDNPIFSDEEIGIALCLGEHPYDLDKIRIAAQLLSSARVDPVRLVRLAVEERCEPVLLHVARVALQIAPELEPWSWLREHLPPRSIQRTDALPHWSRLVSHTAVTAHGGPPRTDWLCRHE